MSHHSLIFSKAAVLPTLSEHDALDRLVLLPSIQPAKTDAPGTGTNKPSAKTDAPHIVVPHPHVDGGGLGLPYLDTDAPDIE